MARRNGIKKLLMYAIVLIGSLFVGFLAYFFARNEETIALTIQQGEIIYLNAGNSYVLPLQHTKPSRATDVTVVSSNGEIVSYQKGTNRLHAIGGGVATITITTTNKDFGPFKFDVFVGNGTSENPWYIENARQFSNIGKGLQEISNENFKPTDSYELIGDIDLGNLYTEDVFWTPIKNFEGTLQGEGHNVLNLKIDADSIANVGLFETLGSKAIVENINFINADVKAANAQNVGIVAGINKGFIGKVSLNGSITSSSNTAVVGGVVGTNQYEDSRPILNMVEAKVAFETRGLTGGIIGHNKGGIVFNSSIHVLNAKVQGFETVASNYAFGGVVGTNQAVIYNKIEGVNEGDFRQAATKHIFVKFVEIEALNQGAYSSKIGAVSYANINGSLSHSYYIPNNYANIIVLKDGLINLTDLAFSANIPTNAKTNISYYNNSSFIEVAAIEDFGLTEVWSIDRTARSLNLDFEASYENPQVSDPSEVIETKQGIIDAIKKVYTSTKPISYKVDITKFEEDTQEVNGEKVVYVYGHEITELPIDTDWTVWTPINSNGSTYSGQFVVEGGKVIIKNIIINSGIANEGSVYYGLFAEIAGTSTVVKNLGVLGVKIEANASLSNQVAGGFAGRISEAYVEGITVDNVQIKNANTAGFVFGTVKSGTIKNVSVGDLVRLEEELVNASDEDEYSYKNPPNKIYTTSGYAQEVQFGGFAGNVLNIVEDINIHYGLIHHAGTSKSDIGGFAGIISTNVTVKNIKVNYGLLISNTTSGKGYFGGVAGLVKTGAVIEYSFSLANIDVIVTAEDVNHAGGIAGELEGGAVIRNSFAGDQSSGEISAKNVGGIVSVNNGEIYQSQAAGVYKGHNVGGIAVVTNGKIESVLITATLIGTGTGSNLTVAGIAVWMQKGSTTKFVISTASISGAGSTELYAETRSYVRYTGFETFLNGVFSGKIFNGTHETGTLDNYIIVGYGSAIRQKGIVGNLSFWIGVLESSEDELRLQGGDNPYTKAGFTDLNNFVWKFEAGQNPKLINIAQNPFAIVEEDAELGE